MKILVINGPNLNLLGEREPDIYGKITLDKINGEMTALANELKIELEFFQSNHEGEIVDIIGKARKDFKAIIMNPAAYTHTSVAIRDAVSSCALPVIEVHISNIYAREEFRHKSLIAPVCKGQISGFGLTSYLLALRAVKELIQ
ncbi:MAG: type II 3-dehydroquinate dehydratase [Elusimicrobia bacterium]|nr:type II 3-dehydroquinate dehydratase [Candidatus Liberimonas magnetica]